MGRGCIMAFWECGGCPFCGVLYFIFLVPHNTSDFFFIFYGLHLINIMFFSYWQ